MLKAGFVSSSEVWCWERQFPAARPVWDGVEFVFDEDFTGCDVVIVYDGLREHLCRRITAKKTIFVAGEPASVKTYNSDFLSQFDLVLTTDRATIHPNVCFGQVAIPWQVGIWDTSYQLLDRPLGYDEFIGWRPRKTKLVSVVSSNKAFTEGHRTRLEFVGRLKECFGDQVDVFGRNINNFGDKKEILEDYAYHIAIENSVYEDYWTEKLADPFLAGSYPIYHGCPNIHQYFSEQALTCIDIRDADAAIQTIRRTIDSNLASRSAQALEKAKMQVLEEYNLFRVLSGLAKKVVREKPGSHRNKRLASEKFYSKYKSPAYRQFRRTTRRIGDFATAAKANLKSP